MILVGLTEPGPGLSVFLMWSHHCGTNCFTYAAYLALHSAGFSERLSDNQARHQTGEFHQVRNSEQPPLSHEDFGIRRSHVGPLRRNRANGSVVHTQQKSLAEPVMAFADADKLPPAKGMERMNYADKMR